MRGMGWSLNYPGEPNHTKLAVWKGILILIKLAHR